MLGLFLVFISSLISVFLFTLKGSCYIYRSRIHTGRIRGFTVFGRAGTGVDDNGMIDDVHSPWTISAALHVPGSEIRETMTC